MKIKNLVLVGCGHSHLYALKHLAMAPMKNVVITLISDVLYTPYSGMIPAYIAKHTNFENSHIDIVPLAKFANTNLINENINKIDFKNKKILFHHRPPLQYDVVSINIGSQAATYNIDNADKHAIKIKPIHTFLKYWDEHINEIPKWQGLYYITIVGGGTSSIEVILAMQYRIRKALEKKRRAFESVKYQIITSHDTILTKHNSKVQQYFINFLQEKDIKLITQTRIREVQEKEIISEQGVVFPSNFTLLATGASPQSWVKNCSIATDKQGCILVKNTLQSLSYPEVFATGDIATIENYKREKSGVYAVKQGRYIYENICKFFENKPLKNYTPQENFLSLISTGNKNAVLSKNNRFYSGSNMWKLKMKIDENFVKRYNTLPTMKEDFESNDKTYIPDDYNKMRCGGCGNKAAGTVLYKVLNNLKTFKNPAVVKTHAFFEDAAVLKMDAKQYLVQSVDFFKNFLDDPFTFGKITANHCLNDILAMGAEPISALVTLTIPLSDPDTMENLTTQILTGAQQFLSEHNTSITGGHTNEGKDLVLGFCINGKIAPQSLLHSSLQPEQTLILTKYLGCGILWAAYNRRKLKGKHYELTLQNMLLSNSEALKILQKYNVTACTDISGFGFIGHLCEMLKNTTTKVDIITNEIPCLENIEEYTTAGIYSSIYEANRIYAHQIHPSLEIDNIPPILFDPQTAGPLLASVDNVHAKDCLDELKELYPQASVVGYTHQKHSTKDINLLKT